MTVAERIRYVKADLSKARQGLQEIHQFCTKHNVAIEPIIMDLIEHEERLGEIHRLVYHDKDLQQFDLGFEITKAKDET